MGVWFVFGQDRGVKVNRWVKMTHVLAERRERFNACWAHENLAHRLWSQPEGDGPSPVSRPVGDGPYPELQSVGDPESRDPT